MEKRTDYYEKLYRERVEKNLKKKASEFGYILTRKDELTEGVS